MKRIPEKPGWAGESREHPFTPHPQPGQPETRKLLPVRFFTSAWRVDLGLGFAPLPDALPVDSGETRLVLDPNAAGPTKFYRVRISMP